MAQGVPLTKSETFFRCARTWRPQRHSRHFWWHQSMEWGQCDDIVALDSLISVSFAHIHLQIMQHVFCLLVGMRKVFLRLRLIYKRYSFVSLLIWCMFLCFLAFFSLISYWSGCRNAHAVRTRECLASSMDLTETLVPLMDLVIAIHLGICYFWSLRNDLFRWLVPDSSTTWKRVNGGQVASTCWAEDTTRSRHRSQREVLSPSLFREVSQSFFVSKLSLSFKNVPVTEGTVPGLNDGQAPRLL